MRGRGSTAAQRNNQQHCTLLPIEKVHERTTANQQQQAMSATSSSSGGGGSRTATAFVSMQPQQQPATDGDGTSSTDSDYFRLFNATNAKVVGLAAFLLVVVYHSALHLMSIRKDACIGLLERGRYQGSHMWQPYGCMIHKYSQADARQCVDAVGRGQTWLLFLGDGRIRQLYGRLVQHFSPEFPATTVESTDQRLHDDVYEEPSHRLKLEYRYFASIDASLHDHVARLADGKQQPKLIVMSAGLTPLNQTLPGQPSSDTPLDDSLTEVDDDYSNAGQSRSTSAPSTTSTTAAAIAFDLEAHIIDVLKDIELNVSALVGPLTRLHSLNTTTLFMLQPSVAASATSDANQTWQLANRHINAANTVAERTLAYSFVRMWRSAALLSNDYPADSRNGFAIGPVALAYDMQILLNLYCNDVVRFGDATCCGRTEALTRIQMGAFAIYSVCIAVLLIMLFMRLDLHHMSLVTAVENGVAASLSPAFEPKYERAAKAGGRPAAMVTSRRRVFQLMFALSRLSAIMLLFYMCDRADYFMKENKWFTYFNLFLPIVYLSVIGLFFTEDTANTEFMSREQTDEMKGAMQLIILSSHLTGAIEIPWVYMMNRCLFSAYLFLLGYGHFIYFWTTADFSLSRLFRVLFRYNMLVVLLCVTMNRPYQFYSFVPLMSFWFVVVYVTMACPPRVHAASFIQQNCSVAYSLMTLKLIVLFSVISVFYLSQIFFDKIVQFGPWQPLFVTDSENGPVHDWWTKWWHDRYSTAFGCAFAFVVVGLQRHGLMAQAAGAQALFPSARLTAALALASLAGLAAYFGMIALCGSMAECNETLPYVVFLPIISYLLLRNLFTCVRSRVSHFFGWFGQISFEVFTAQHHIWMVSDSNGVLVLLPTYPVLNVILTSYIFICVAHELRQLTVQLMPFVVPSADSTPSACIQRVFSGLLLLTAGSLAFTYFSRTSMLNTNAL